MTEEGLSDYQYDILLDKKHTKILEAILSKPPGQWVILEEEYEIEKIEEPRAKDIWCFWISAPKQPRGYALVYLHNTINGESICALYNVSYLFKWLPQVGLLGED